MLNYTTLYSILHELLHRFTRFYMGRVLVRTSWTRLCCSARSTRRARRPARSRWRRGGGMPLDQVQACSQALGLRFWVSHKILGQPQVLEQAPCFSKQNWKKSVFSKNKSIFFSVLQKIKIALPCLRGKELDGCRECTARQLQFLLTTGSPNFKFLSLPACPGFGLFEQCESTSDLFSPSLDVCSLKQTVIAFHNQLSVPHRLGIATACIPHGFLSRYRKKGSYHPGRWSWAYFLMNIDQIGCEQQKQDTESILRNVIVRQYM